MKAYFKISDKGQTQYAILNDKGETERESLGYLHGDTFFENSALYETEKATELHALFNSLAHYGRGVFLDEKPEDKRSVGRPPKDNNKG